MFICLDKLPECDRKTDRQTDMQSLLERHALQAIQTNCQNGVDFKMSSLI